MAQRDTRRRPQSPWYARVVAAFAFLVLYVPLITLIIGSFVSKLPDGSLKFTLDWYLKVLTDDAILAALGNSLIIASSNTVFSTLIGTGAALALERGKFPGRKFFDVMIQVPLIMPEIVMGLSLLIWFVFLKITLGTFSIILAHVTFSVSYVILTVRSRLQGFDHSLEEAARDLGATSLQTFWRVTLPLILPGVVSGALMAFTLSFDDFLITFFTSGVGSETLPLRIYAMIRFGVSPELNALSALMLAMTVLLVGFVFGREGQDAGSEPA